MAEKLIGEIVVINDPEGEYDGLEMHPGAPNYDETLRTIGVQNGARLIRRECSEGGHWLVLEHDQTMGMSESDWERLVSEAPLARLVHTGEIGELDDWPKEEQDEEE